MGIVIILLMHLFVPVKDLSASEYQGVGDNSLTKTFADPELTQCLFTQEKK